MVYGSLLKAAFCGIKYSLSWRYRKASHFMENDIFLKRGEKIEWKEEEEEENHVK